MPAGKTNLRGYKIAARLFVLALTAATPGLPAAAWAAARVGDHAAVLMYHRFGDSRYPSTNTTMAQLRAHLLELSANKYSVRPLPEIIAAFIAGSKLPDRTVALTIDDAYSSFYRNAWPLIKNSGLPITLFIATGTIHRGQNGFMSWDQIRELMAAGVVIGSQTKTHPHLPAVSQQKLHRELALSNQRFRRELGLQPRLIAYPYGEYGRREQAAAARAGFIAGFGQQSGIAYAGGDRYGLPRFAMNEKYGGLGRLRMAANGLPLKISDFQPQDLALPSAKAPANPPTVRFKLGPAMGSPKDLTCYASNQAGRLKLDYLAAGYVRLVLKNGFSHPRGRINCTMPAGPGRWRWLGRQFYIPRRSK